MKTFALFPQRHENVRSCKALHQVLKEKLKRVNENDKNCRQKRLDQLDQEKNSIDLCEA